MDFFIEIKDEKKEVLRNRLNLFCNTSFNLYKNSLFYNQGKSIFPVERLYVPIPLGVFT